MAAFLIPFLHCMSQSPHVAQRQDGLVVTSHAVGPVFDPWLDHKNGSNCLPAKRLGSV